MPVIEHDGQTYEVQPTTWAGKPTGNIQVTCPDGRVVTFRKRTTERKPDVMRRVERWIAQGAQGIPGAAPRGRRLR